jgi:hypothetical protein
MIGPLCEEKKLVVPQNEKELVELFKKFGPQCYALRDLSFYSDYPDCVATKADSGVQVRIEFEFRSSSFLAHKHYAHLCDWVVCWIDNSPRLRELGLEVKEFRRAFGLGFNVWFQGAKDEYAEAISDLQQDQTTYYWSVAQAAHKGDLVIFWLASPYSYFWDLFELLDDPHYERKPGWRTKPDYMATIKRVAALEVPIRWEWLKSHPVLKESAFVRCQMQGRTPATDYWTELYQMITAVNPQCAEPLARFL